MAITIERYIEAVGNVPASVKPAMQEVVKDHTVQMLNIIPTMHTSRSGALRNSWRARYDNDGLTGIVSTTKKYAPAQETGSGLFSSLPAAGETNYSPGPRAKYPIYPRNAQALFWPGIKGGRPVAMVMHPGVKPQFYARRTVARVAEPFVDAATAAVSRILTGGR